MPSIVWMRACGVVSEDLPRCGLSKESKKERRLDSALGESRQDSASQPKSRREDWRSTYSPSLKLYSKSRTLAGRSPQELELVTVPVIVLARLTTTRGSLLITRSDRRSRLRRAMKSCSGYSRSAFSLSVPAILRFGTGRNAPKANGPHNARD